MMRIAFSAAVFVAMSGAATAQQAENWSFEDGTLHGWTAVGNAFATQPTLGNNIAPRRPGESPGSAGDWWIGTYENRPSDSVPLGTVQGDGPIGSLISPPFLIGTGTISFLIGGGSRSEAALLMVRVAASTGGSGQIFIRDGYYTIVRGVAGSDREQMSRVGWDVGGFRGQTGRIVITDQSSGPWGHINVDDFRFSWLYDAHAPSGVPGAPPPISRKPPPIFRPSRPLPMPPGDLFGGTVILLPAPEQVP